MTPIEAIHTADRMANRTKRKACIVAHRSGLSVLSERDVIKYGWAEKVLETVSPKEEECVYW